MKKLYFEEKEPKNLEELVEEFYRVKSELRDTHRHIHGKERKPLMERKNELLVEIRRQLSKLSKQKADKIRKRLWEELGVVI